MTKIDIISGFLGAGKTTFIKKMIEEVFKGEKIVLIENEFGEVGIDGGFLKDAGIEITEMNSGCICCSLVGDFGKNLHEVIEKFHPDRILIEPSGVGKLSDVMKSVIDVEKDEDVKLNGLITVVNALKASKQMKAFGEFFNNQIEYATTVVLSRSQKATPEQLELCVKQIQALNPKAAVITTPWDEIKGEQILKVVEGQDSLEVKLLAEQHAKEEALEHEHEHEHEHETDEHIWTSPKNAQLMLSAVYNAICKVDPSDKQTYTKNKDAYAKQLSDLDNAYRSAVDNAKNKTIVLADKFPFRYLAHEYGLEFSAAFAACSDESEPGVSTMIKLTKTIKENNIPAVYYLEFSSTKIADTLCDETGATKLMLHSCHNVSKQDIENNVSYVDLMKQNLENLKLTLNG